MMRSTQHILVDHGLVTVPQTAAHQADPNAATPEALATVMANLVHYGYGLDAQAFERLRQLDAEALVAWWTALEAILANLSGDDRRMGDVVVYKNFPSEVLAMSEAEYWFRQILMYWGLPNELVTQEPAPREALGEAEIRLRVLHLAHDDSPAQVLSDLLGLPARWTPQQWEDVAQLSRQAGAPLDLSGVGFKENLVQLAGYLLVEGLAQPRVETATDVLRLAQGLSEGDISLRVPSKLRGFKRRERRFLLAMLEQAAHLVEDFARRPEMFKRLLRALRPGDYADRYPRVVEAYNALYRGDLPASFASRVEAGLASRDPATLALLATRPGEFLRRLHHSIDRFGLEAARAFAPLTGELTTTQLLKLMRYLETINLRRWRTIAPRGNWTKLQILERDEARHLDADTLGTLLEPIHAELGRRVHEHLGGPVALDPRVDWVTLQTSDSELTPYGRGTRFAIPDDVTFIRTASYWKTPGTAVNLWFDNGWNFFDGAWGELGVCCWDSSWFEGAVFSGDPTNSKDLEGRACQLIDLDLDQLATRGVRFAVWSLLCYSYVPFHEAEEVFAALQWGIDPDAGALFEPARVKLAFPVAGESYTKYVAYLDLERRHIVYIDANLRSRVQSASQNGLLLKTMMPAFCEYLDTLPTVYDLMKHAPQDPEGVPVLYDDAEVSLQGERAYIFESRNESNHVEALSLVDMLRA